MDNTRILLSIIDNFKAEEFDAAQDDCMLLPRYYAKKITDIFKQFGPAAAITTTDRLIGWI